MKCAKCNDRESTGFLMRLCDPCFEEFATEHEKRVAVDGVNQISDVEFVEIFGHAPKKDGN